MEIVLLIVVVVLVAALVVCRVAGAPMRGQRRPLADDQGSSEPRRLN